MLRQIAEDKQDVTVLNLPFGRSDGIQRVGFFNPEAMWLQTIHNKPIIGGYILRMSENDKKMLETGIFRNIVASQTTGIKAKSSKSREEKIKSIIKNLHDKGNPIVKPLKYFVGEKKYQAIINFENKPKQSDSPVEFEEIVDWKNEFSQVKIGYIIVIDPDLPCTAGSLEYLKQTVDLQFLGEEYNYQLYKVVYDNH